MTERPTAPSLLIDRRSSIEAEQGKKTAEAHVRAGVLVVGLIAVIALCVVTVYSDLVLQGSWIAHNALPIGALTLFLFLVTVSNRLAARAGTIWRLRRSEA